MPLRCAGLFHQARSTRRQGESAPAGWPGGQILPAGRPAGGIERRVRYEQAAARKRGYIALGQQLLVGRQNGIARETGFAGQRPGSGKLRAGLDGTRQDQLTPYLVNMSRQRFAAPPSYEESRLGKECV